MAEYAFVLSVIVIAIITAFGVLSGAIASSIDDCSHHRQEHFLSAKTASPGKFRGRRLTSPTSQETR